MSMFVNIDVRILSHTTCKPLVHTCLHAHTRTLTQYRLFVRHPACVYMAVCTYVARMALQTADKYKQSCIKLYIFQYEVAYVSVCV